KPCRCQRVMQPAAGGVERTRTARDVIGDIDDRDYARARLRQNGGGIMAKFRMRSAGNVGFLLEAGGEPLEAIGKGQELVAAARLVAKILRDSPEGCGDVAEIRDPLFRGFLVHRSTASTYHCVNARDTPASACASESCADYMPACGFISSRGRARCDKAVSTRRRAAQTNEAAAKAGTLDTAGRLLLYWRGRVRHGAGVVDREPQRLDDVVGAGRVLQIRAGKFLVRLQRHGQRPLRLLVVVE